MEANEIMRNEEVTEAVETATEEIVSKSSGSKFKTAAIGGLTVLIGGLVVQYVVIPTVVKIKNNRRNSGADFEELPVAGNEEVNGSDEDKDEE